MKNTHNAQQSLGRLQIFTSGFALFGMFFGAGNLIIPSLLGVNSGHSMTWALIGFLLTAVLLPLFGIVAVATSGQGLLGLASRVGKRFGMFFTVLVYIAIGPLYALPRVGAVSYELSMKPIVTQGQWWVLPLFMILFFGFALAFTINENKLVDYMGAILTPVLAILIGALCVIGIMRLTSIDRSPVAPYTDRPLSAGLTEGYFTMDALAALVFALIIVESLRSKGTQSKSSLWKASVVAGGVAVGVMALFYVGLALLGSRVPGTFDNGAAVLSEASNLLFGGAGHWIFAFTVIFACVTTGIGLFGSCAHFFHSIVPTVSYRTFLTLIFIASIFAGCLGLTGILTFVSPLLQLLYPIAISLIFITLLDVLIPGHLQWTYRIGVGVATVFAFIGFVDAIIKLGDTGASEGTDIFSYLRAFFAQIPLASQRMIWVVPVLIAVAVGLIADWKLGVLTATRGRQVEASPSGV